MAYPPARKPEFGPWGTNFSDVCGDNAATLGLSAGNLTEIANASSNFNTKFATSESLKASAKGAVALTDSQFDTSTAVYRKYAKMFLANPNVDKDILGSLGLPTQSGSIGPVTIPINLTTTGYSNGQNKMKWGRNGNANGTQFVIEAKIGTSVEWTWVGMTTKSKWTHESQVPGTQVVYRIYAQRAEVSSGFSNEAVVYSNSDSEMLFLSEAA